MSVVRSSLISGGSRNSFHQVNHGAERNSFASKCRDLVLGGEPAPPTVEQIQQHYLQQHYAQEHLEATSGRRTSGGARRFSFNQPNLSLHRTSERKAFERRWSRTSSVTPRPADVAHALEQLQVRGTPAVDVEDAPAQYAQERAPLVTSRPTSYAAIPWAPSDAATSGTTIRTVLPGEPTPALLAPAAPSIPGPKAGEQEVRTLITYTIPVWATHLLELSINTVTVLVIGHLGTAELAGASLASLTGNVTGFCVLQGFVAGLDATLPAAWSSERPWMVGVWTQRMVLVLLVLLIPISITWTYAESILLSLRQDPEVAHLAAIYLRILVFSLPAYAGFETCRRYLQSQGLFSAPTIAVGVASVFNLPLQILLVHGPKSIALGFIGSPLASVMSYWTMLLFCLVQCYLAPRDAWAGLTRKAFEPRGLIVVWNLGIASTVAIASEWLVFEFSSLISATLGTTALGAQSVLLTTCSMTYQLPSGLGVAAAVRIGNLLGANQPAWAGVSARTALWCALLGGTLNSTLLFFFRNSLGRLFSSDPGIIETVSKIVFPYIFLFQVADGICGVGSGILRGSGRQTLGAIWNIFAYWVCGLPLALYLVFSRGLGIVGIWIGLTAGLVLAAIGFSVIILRSDWDAEAEKVLNRIAEDEIPSAMVEANIEANIESVLEEVEPITEENEGELEYDPAPTR